MIEYCQLSILSPSTSKQLSTDLLNNKSSRILFFCIFAFGGYECFLRYIYTFTKQTQDLYGSNNYSITQSLYS